MTPNHKKENGRRGKRVVKPRRAENQELQNLKRKCNRLLDVVEKLSVEKSRWEREAKEAKKVRNSLDSEGEKLVIEIFITAFSEVVKIADENNCFVPYTYDSKYAKNFMKITSGELEKIIKTATSMDTENFISIAAKMQLIAKKTVFWNNKKMYLLSRTACEFILQEKSKEDVIQDVVM